MPNYDEILDWSKPKGRREMDLDNSDSSDEEKNE